MTRRILPLLTLLLFVCVTHAQQQLAQRVDAVGMTVADLDASLAFYTHVLCFEKVSEEELHGEDLERLTGVFGARVRTARLKLGDESLVLTDYLAPEGDAYPHPTRSNDRWFQHVAIVVRDMDEAYRLLRSLKVRHASTGPQTLPDWNPNAGGIKAFYFRDLDGHFLEIIWFPRGKGDPRWQDATRREKLFMGIDHTAIVVGATEASLRFYRDLLGLTVAGESENFGPEQERLNNVFGARLRITGLRAPFGGIGVEFLEYLAPGNGRPTPGDLDSNDLAHWQTTLIVRDVNAASQHLFQADADFVSPGAVNGSALVRDPDGHALLLTTRP